MVTITPVLYHRKDKAGNQKIAIRITRDRKSSYVFIGQSLNKKYWNKSAKGVKANHPNADYLNALITKKLNEVNANYISTEIEDKELSAQEIHKTIKGTRKFTFNQEAEKHLNNLKAAGKFNRISSESPFINHFKAFIKEEGKNDIEFKNITVPLIKKYQAWIKGTRMVSQRTVMNNMVILRGLFNQTIHQGFDRKYYPFGKGKIKIKFPDTTKLGLNKEQVAQLENLNLSDHPNMRHALNVWLFLFYMAGMRVSDALRLQWADINDGRLNYKMGKNEKGGSIKIPEKAWDILAQYDPEKDTTGLVFPELKSMPNLKDTYAIQKRINICVKSLNYYLKKIGKDILKLEEGKKLTCHIARHTFASIAGDKVPLQMLQKLYRHTDIKTTINYQKDFIFKDADEALESVIGK